MARKTKHVFCLEDDWWGTMKKPSSIFPMLQLLSHWEPYRVRYIHRNAATRETLEYYLKKWRQKQYSDYPILYLSFHGTSGCLHLGDNRTSKSTITLDWLEDLLQGCCSKRIIYFGACATLALNGNRLRSFLRRTNALAVCGYTKDVDWLQSTAFDLLAFAAMQENALTRAGARCMARRIVDDGGKLRKRLGFRMVVAN